MCEFWIHIQYEMCVCVCVWQDISCLSHNNVYKSSCKLVEHAQIFDTLTKQNPFKWFDSNMMIWTKGCLIWSIISSEKWHSLFCATKVGQNSVFLYVSQLICYNFPWLHCVSLMFHNGSMCLNSLFYFISIFSSQD